MSEERPPSGFMNSDYLLAFHVADAGRRAQLLELCREQLDGEQITTDTWELSTELDPHQLEERIVELLGQGDHAVYYYLTKPLPDPAAKAPAAKRIFRVVLSVDFA